MSEKIKTKDFRRGNLFQYENCFYIAETIRDNFIYGVNKNGFAPGEFPIELIKPIPLTSEILLACGWRKAGKSIHGNKFRFPFVDWGFTIENSFEEGRWFFGHEYYDSNNEDENNKSFHFCYDLEFLHTLQNIFHSFSLIIIDFM